MTKHKKKQKNHDDSGSDSEKDRKHKERDESLEREMNRLQTIKRPRMWQTVDSSDSEDDDAKEVQPHKPDKRETHHKEHKHHHHHHHSRGHSSKSSDDSSSDTNSDSDESESESDSSSSSVNSDNEEKKKQKKEKHHKHSEKKKEKHKKDKESRKKHKKHKKKDSDEKKHKKHKKKHKKSKQRHIEGVIDQNEYGKYGIIKESDIFRKQRDFEAWVHEVKKTEIPQTKRDLMILFREYMEDYNTATLPHLKYYNVEKWEVDEHKKKLSNEYAANHLNVENFDFTNDEKQRQAEFKKYKEQSAQMEFSAIVQTMDQEKIAAMRAQQQLRLEMQNAYKRGDLETARKIESRLNPEQK